MRYTVSDFYLTFKDTAKLIAGSNGLTNEIESVGLLDYEIVPELKDKYYKVFFEGKYLVISSLLFAKDNPYLIVDAVKSLIDKGNSALAVKNVFRLPIPESVIRYADSKNFPIFLLDTMSRDAAFEKITYEVLRRGELLKNADFLEKELDDLMMDDQNLEEIERKAIKINPSFSNQFFAMYIKCSDMVNKNALISFSERYRHFNSYDNGDIVTPYKSGIMIIKSIREKASLNLSRLSLDIRDCIFIDYGEKLFISAIGVSETHNSLMYLKEAMDEATFASIYNLSLPEQDLSYFGDLGSYKIIFPYAKDSKMYRFSKRLIDPIEAYDYENNTSLVETLNEYVKCDFSLQKTAEVLNQHEQTIRYRINKIYALTNLNHRSHSDLEQLSLALKIFMVRKYLGY